MAAVGSERKYAPVVLLPARLQNARSLIAPARKKANVITKACACACTRACTYACATVRVRVRGLRAYGPQATDEGDKTTRNVKGIKFFRAAFASLWDRRLLVIITQVVIHCRYLNSLVF